MPPEVLDAIEYTLRAMRHTHDALWVEHKNLTGHKRASLPNTEPCAVCMALAAATDQAGQVLAGFLAYRRSV